METFFSIFPLVDGMMDNKTQFLISTLSQIMAAKMYERISYVKGWVNIQIAFAVARSYSWELHISELQIPLRNQELDWALPLGLELAQ